MVAPFGSRFRPLGALLTAVLIMTPGPAAAAVAAGPARPARPVRVMQFNFCGSICNKGTIDRPGDHNDVVEDIRDRIVTARPDIVTLNEACEAQVIRVKRLLAGSSRPMSGVFRDQREDPRCEGGRRFGDAVLTAGRAGRQEVLGLPNLGPEHRAILCLHTDAAGPLLACTLHLVTGAVERRRQLAAAARTLNARAAGSGEAVLLGGDFNAYPREMGALINPARGGRFVDTDPQAAPTAGHKIDYVLYERGAFTDPAGGPWASAFSDHHALLGLASRH